MKSRHASRTILEKQTGYLITITKGSFTIPLAVSRNVKDAFEFAKLHGQLAEPNRSYKGVIRQLKKHLECKLWNKATHGETFPPQDHIELRPIKML